MAAATKVLLTDLASSVNHVPSNYIRPISDRPNLSDVQSSDATIPLIDLQGLHGPNHSNIIKQIGQACQQDGFFQIKNHGIPETLISTIMNIAREFFRLPESERMKSYSDDPTKTTRLSTSFNVKTEKVSNWRDFLRLHCYPLEDYVNEWPSNPPSFREDVAEYCTSVRGLVPRLLEAISESLGLERDCIEKALGKQGQHMEGVIVEIPEIVLAEIRANPTRTVGWFSTKLKEAWNDIFPLTERSVNCEGRVAPIFRPGLDRGDKSLVVLPGGCAFTSGGVQDGMGVPASGFSSTTAMLCESMGVSYGTAYARGATDSYIHNGEQANHESDSSFPSNSGLQSAVSLTGIGYGGSTTHVPRRGSDKGGLEADRMELEGGGETEASV